MKHIGESPKTARDNVSRFASSWFGKNSGSRSVRRRLFAALRMAYRILGIKPRRGLGFLGIAAALGLASASLAMANGIYINANTDGRCASINDPQDSFAVGSPSFTQDAATYINLRNNAAECNSNNKATQTNSVLFYRPAGVTGVGATSLSLGGEIYVNGLSMLNGYVHIPMATLQMGRDTGAGFKIGSTTTKTVHAGDIAIGGQASADGSVADGTAQGFAVAIGNNSEAIGTYALSVGTAAKARGQRSTALGPSTQAEGYSALAAGRFAQAYGPNTTAVGRNAVAGIANQLTVAEGAVAVGYGARARAENAIAIGRNALVEENLRDAMALGFGATVENDFGVALGSNARTGNMVAYPTATLAGTVYNFAGGAPHAELSVGSLAQQRQVTNVASGRISSDSTDAINGSQLFAAFSEIGKTHTRVNDLEARVAALPVAGANPGQTGVAESVRAAIGDGAVINEAGVLVMPEIALKSLGATVDGNGNTIPAEQPNTLLGAISALDNEMIKNDRAIGAIIDSSLLWHPDKNAFDAERSIPQLDGDGKPLLDSEGNPLRVRENGKITNLAPGALTPESSDAVTGAQLSETNERLSDLATRADRLGEDALLWNETAGAFDASHGTSATNNISNVADGVLVNDAVNVGQLKTVASAASTAQITADAAKAAADNAQASADRAKTSADAAQEKADDALAAAGTAQTIADGAKTAADGAKGAADQAQATADRANTAAGAAQSTADSADRKADLAAQQLSGIGPDETVAGRIAESAQANQQALEAATGDLNNRIDGLNGSIGTLTEDALQWSDSKQAYSAGRGDNDKNRIVNLDAGVDDTDAVNVGQLKTIEQAAGAAKDAADAAQSAAGTAQTAAVAAQSTADSADRKADLAAQQLTGIGPGETVAGRIAESAQANQQALETAAGGLNNRIDGLNESIGNLTEDALQWDGDKQAYNAAHGDNDKNRIVNLDAGVDDTDAVNVEQLKTVEQAASVAQSTADGAKAAADGAKSAADLAQTSANTAQQTADAARGVADSADKKADRAAAQLAGIEPNETVADRIEQNRKANQDALEAATGGLNGRMDEIDSVMDSLSDDALKWDEKERAYSASRSEGGTSRLANVADGKNAKDAVNVSQLQALMDSSPIQYSAVGSSDTPNSFAPSQEVSLVGKNRDEPVRLQNVGAGRVERASTDATNGAQLYEATEATARSLGGAARVAADGSLVAPSYNVGGKTHNSVGDAVAAIDSRLTSIDSSVSDLQRTVSNNQLEARRGIAAAMAMPRADMPSAPGKVSYAAQLGHYKGATAFGAAAAIRFDTEFPFAATGAVSWAGGDDVGISVGFKGEF